MDEISGEKGEEKDLIEKLNEEIVTLN